MTVAAVARRADTHQRVRSPSVLRHTFIAVCAAAAAAAAGVGPTIVPVARRVLLTEGSSSA